MPLLNCRTVLTIAGAGICLCVYGCGIASSTYLVSSAKVEHPGAHISLFERMYGRPDRTVMAGGIAFVVQPSNAIMISEQRKGILFAFSSSHKIQPQDYRFQPFYYENSALDTREPFVVELLFSTEDHETIFDAMDIVLEDGKGNKHHPVSVATLAPFAPAISSLSDRSKWIVSPQCVLPGAEVNPYRMHSEFVKKYELKPPNHISLRKGGLYCLAVKFGIPPLDPRLAFTLKMNDVGVDGQKVHVPNISFVPDTDNDARP